jgi:hypothetical protein
MNSHYMNKGAEEIAFNLTKFLEINANRVTAIRGLVYPCCRSQPAFSATCKVSNVGKLVGA